MLRIGLVGRGLSVLLLIALSLTPVTLRADDREDHAQELVRIAEQRLAEGNEEAALRIADTVLAEFSDTRAANKAREIKKAAESKLGGKAPPTKSRPVSGSWPNPNEAFKRGCFYPGGGQFYLDQDIGGCACLGGVTTLFLSAIGWFVIANMEGRNQETAVAWGAGTLLGAGAGWLTGALLAKSSARKMREMK